MTRSFVNFSPKAYYAELKEVIEQSKRMESPAWALVWWDMIEKAWGIRICWMFEVHTEEPSETTKELILEQILMLSTLEQRMYEELEKLFDSNDVTRLRKKWTHDINQRIRKDVKTIYNKLVDGTEPCKLYKTFAV